MSIVAFCGLMLFSVLIATTEVFEADAKIKQKLFYLAGETASRSGFSFFSVCLTVIVRIYSVTVIVVF